MKELRYRDNLNHVEYLISEDMLDSDGDSHVVYAVYMQKDDADELEHVESFRYLDSAKAYVESKSLKAAILMNE